MLRLTPLTRMAIVLLTVAPVPSTAGASLVVDLREAGTGAKQTRLIGVGESVLVDVYVTVTGTDADPSSYGLRTIAGSIVSVGDGKLNVRGRMGDFDQFNTPTTQQRVTALRPFAALGSQNGDETDIDVDGDIDLGAPNHDGSDGFFVANADAMQLYVPGGPGRAITNGVEWRVGRVEVTNVGALLGLLVFLPRRDGDGSIPADTGLWREGGSVLNGKTGAVVSGAPLLIGPEPGTPTLVVAIALMFCCKRRRGRNDYGTACA